MSNSNYVKIDEIIILPVDRLLIRGLSINKPVCGIKKNELSIEISGWIVGTSHPVLSIELISNHQRANILRVHLPRQDVADHCPDFPFTERCGFNQRIGVLGLPSVFKLTLNAIIKRGDEQLQIPIAIIHGNWSIEVLASQITRQPLMVTGLARSGTTWMMHLLSEVPGIIVPAMYPYETRVAVYWMHTLKVLTDPADYSFSTVPDGFEINTHTLGHNPYNHPSFIERFCEPAEMKAWHGEKQILRYMEFCKENIDEYYNVVEISQKQHDSKYYAEKMLPSRMQDLFYSAYEDAKEIILVRDFRDLICSAMAFNKRRNTSQFGRQYTDTDEQWIRNIGARGVTKILRSINERKNKILLIRYEKLITSPHETLEIICQYLGLNVTESEIDSILTRSKLTTKSLSFHQTSGDPSKSIERWRDDMDDKTKRLCEDVMGDALVQLGYKVE